MHSELSRPQPFRHVRMISERENRIKRALVLSEFGRHFIGLALELLGTDGEHIEATSLTVLDDEPALEASRVTERLPTLGGKLTRFRAEPICFQASPEPFAACSADSSTLRAIS